MQQDTQNQSLESKSQGRSHERSTPFEGDNRAISSPSHPSATKEQRDTSRSRAESQSRSPKAHQNRFQDPTRDIKDRTFVQDTTVDIVIATRRELQGSQGNTVKPKPSDENIPLKMTISTWMLEDQLYYTLTFSSLVAHHLRSQTRTVNRPIKPDSYSNPSSRASPSSAGSVWCSACGMPSTSSPTAKLTVSRYPPLEPLGQPSQASSPSILQKTLKMKDALISSMELPSFCLWKDRSLAISNQAMIQLMRQPTDPLNHDPQDILDRFEVWDQDFTELLKPDEYPVVQICRLEARSTKSKLGLINHEGKRYTYDCIGKGVFDETSNEFLAAIVTLKDVTEYTDIIKSQNEKNEQQFQLICDTMPQMVGTFPKLGLRLC